MNVRLAEVLPIFLAIVVFASGCANPMGASDDRDQLMATALPSGLPPFPDDSFATIRVDHVQAGRKVWESGRFGTGRIHLKGESYRDGALPVDEIIIDFYRRQNPSAIRAFYHAEGDAKIVLIELDDSQYVPVLNLLSSGRPAIAGLNQHKGEKNFYVNGDEFCIPRR